MTVLRGRTLAECSACALAWTVGLPPWEALVKPYAAATETGEPLESAAREQWRAFKQDMLDRLDVARVLPEGSAPRRALEVGSGEGILLDILAERGWTVTGIEPCAAAADRARERGHTVLCSGVELADFPAGTFDLVLSFHVIEHLRDPWVFLARVAPWLSPSGVLVLETPLTRAPEIGGHLHFFSEPALTHSLKNVGLTPAARCEYRDAVHGLFNIAVAARFEG